ncbi:MAG: hypothetical protein C0620_11545 [Desulfuromonas sp.]|mgnify:CR=1 FL=1|nr:MAG: hypothetical protein C0620_11545 [Desulfuromonas sp.]
MPEPILSSQLEQALILSIEHYQTILSQMTLISRLLSSSDPGLPEQVTRLVALQQQAREEDQRLMVMLREHERNISVHPLFRQRMELLAEVLRLNHLLLPKINGMMALISHELSDLKKGRSVLGGYKQGTHNQGRIIRSSA